MTRKKRIKLLKKKPKASNNIQRFTQVQNLGRGTLTSKEFRILSCMVHSSKALYNVGLFAWKQFHLETGKSASISQIDSAMKADVNYWGLQSNSVQAIRQTLLHNVTSFFHAVKDFKANPDKYTGRPQFPKYLKHTQKRIIEIYQVPKTDKQGFWKLPMNRDFEKRFGNVKIKLPANLRDKKVTYIEILPKQNGRFFEVHYTFEVDKSQMKQQSTTTKNVLSIDLGIDNLMSCACSTGETFLLDGFALKSMNRYFNKMLSNQQQTNVSNGLSKRMVTHKQANLWKKRKHQIKGYFDRAIGILFDKVKELDIDTIVVGYNEKWKQNANMGRKNNQQFVSIPYRTLLSAIENKCLKEGTRFIEQEESYTSKASFLDDDRIPTLEEAKQNYPFFKGKRITRGMYRSSSGKHIHADINGALNILRKADILELPSNLKIQTPKRIMIETRKAFA